MRIGEVSHRSGVSVRMLRHYDSLGLVRPRTRTATGYRDYADADLRRILHVEALRSLGMGLAEVAEALPDATDDADAESHPVSESRSDPDVHDPSRVLAPPRVLDELIDRTRARISAEQELLERLEHTRSRSPADWDDVLRTIALLRAVRSHDPRERQRAALSPDSPLPAAALAEAALTEDETNTAGAVRWALARAAAQDEGLFLVAVDEALASDSEQTRRRAVGVLADLPGAPAADRLTRALADDDAEVRAGSALALASRIGNPSLAGNLSRKGGSSRIRDGSEDEQRPGGRDPDAAVTRLIRDELVRMIVAGRRDVEAAEALALLAAAQATTTSAVVDALLECVRDGDAPAAGRQRAVQALGELRGSRVRAVLLDLTEDADPVVARVAGYLVGRLQRDDPEFGEGDDSAQPSGG